MQRVDLQKYYKKASMMLIKSVSRQSEGLSKQVVESGGLEAIVTCLEDFDPGVKESAAFAVAAISSHTANLAQGCALAGQTLSIVSDDHWGNMLTKQIKAMTFMGGFLKY